MIIQIGISKDNVLFHGDDTIYYSNFIKDGIINWLGLDLNDELITILKEQKEFKM